MNHNHPHKSQNISIVGLQRTVERNDGTIKSEHEGYTPGGGTTTKEDEEESIHWYNEGGDDKRT